MKLRILLAAAAFCGGVAAEAFPEPWRLDKPLELVGMRAWPKAVATDGKVEPGVQVFGADGFLPFVDRFGQFKHAEWPGKVHDEADLVRAKEDEAKWLAENAAAGVCRIALCL